jgi:ADP-ribose pyrophosphatase YjhB (NUDIX family)
MLLEGAMSHSRYPKLIVGALLRNVNGEIFVARFSKIEGQYAIPGGHVEYGETVAEALVRELEEGTNLTPTSYRLPRVGERIRPPLHKDGRHHLVYLDFLVDGASVRSKQMQSRCFSAPQSFLPTIQVGDARHTFTSEIPQGW